MALTFNQFQVELRNRGIDGHLAVVLTTMYEQQCEISSQLDLCAKLIGALTETVANFAGLHEATQGQVQDLRRRVSGEVDGVDLSSIPLRDEPKN